MIKGKGVGGRGQGKANRQREQNILKSEAAEVGNLRPGFMYEETEADWQ